MAIESGKSKPVCVFLETLGCKLNQAETEALAGNLVNNGFRIAASAGAADVYILNTCTVTHIADRKARHLLRMAYRRNPNATLIATGCYARRAPGEISKVDGVIVLRHIQEVIPFLHSLPENKPGKETGAQYASGGIFKARNRAFIGIQNGCDHRCAYCIVPLVRGKPASRSPEEVLNEITARVGAGYKEVVLTGTEVGEYRSEGIYLAGLIRRILSETVIERLRLSSLQPGEITPELLALWRNNRLCPHFHISLQSGSDPVLKRMRRCYTTGDYRQAVSLIRSAIPDASVTNDVITGFPGETEGEFKESYVFCRGMGFTRIHVFPYSLRPGTEAATMPGQVEEKVKKERTAKMLALAKGSAGTFHRRFLSREMPVLWEQKTGSVWSGYTPNYIRIYCRSNDNLTDKITNVRLEKLWRDGVMANALSP